MHAAVVTDFDSAPRCAEFPTPTASRDTEMVVDVVAAGLHPRVRSQANGSHYTSTADLPLVPGIDGVGRGPDGVLRYFVLPDTTLGAMAERTVVDVRRSVVLPEQTDPIAVAAAMNPAMSSWVALRERISFEAGRHVLMLGTGNAAQLAVQIASFLGARKIVVAGRNAEAVAALRALGATDGVVLDGSRAAAERLGRAGADIDVVIDYLWGQPAADALTAIVPLRADDDQQLTWIQIGSVAGPTAPIPSAALRATRLQIVGSGQGSVAPRALLAALPPLAELISKGTFEVHARPVPLRDVEQAWTSAAASDERIVITP